MNVCREGTEEMTVEEYDQKEWSNLFYQGYEPSMPPNRHSFPHCRILRRFD